jgi:hypothetical protein
LICVIMSIFDSRNFLFPEESFQPNLPEQEQTFWQVQQKAKNQKGTNAALGTQGQLFTDKVSGHTVSR